MHVCDVVQFHSPLSGGVKRYTDDKTRYLASRPGWRHVVIVPSHRDAVTRIGPLTTHEVRSPALPGSKSYRMLVSRSAIRAVVTRERPDVIEVGDAYAAAWIAAGAAREQGIPVVAVYHSDYPRALGRTAERFAGPLARIALEPATRAYLRGLYSRMDATVATSRASARILAEDLGVRRLATVPLGTDTDLFRARPERSTIRGTLGVADDQVLLLYAGRLAREKHVRELPRMMDLLRDDGRFVLLIAGDGEQWRPIRAAERSAGDVRWLRYVSDSERLAQLYAAADLFVHPGTVETFGLSALESMACGTRVIGVEGGGLDALLEREAVAVKAARPDGASLAHAVRRAVALDEGEHERCERSRDVRDAHDWRTTYERLERLYERVAAAPRPAGGEGRSEGALCGATVPED
jgi:alpha-1,6-mannosyltransferase